MKKRLGTLFFVITLAAGAIYFTISPVRAAVNTTYDQLKLLIGVMELIQENYVEEKDSKKLLTGAVSGMVKTLDPFSQFMEPEIYKEMKTETEGQFGGLGIRISVKENWLTVITPLPGTPAYKIGILPDDKIIKIEGKTTEGISIEDAVKKLRGNPGTKVSITIVRDGAKEPQEFTITREIIKIETIKSKMLTSDIGYIRLSEFNASSDKDLDKALGELQSKGMKSLVFDLRNNPGGLLDTAVNVCKEFVGDNKLIVYTQGRRAESRRDYSAHGKAPYATLPMIILVNRGSASGSQIVAGAMQDLKRSLIIGTTTFGKGSVQSVFPLSEGNALRLTTAKYYTPAGRSIHRNEETGNGGIIPDIMIDVPREIEAKLYAQSEDVYAPGKEPAPPANKKEKERVEDVALERAIELLKARSVLITIKE